MSILRRNILLSIAAVAAGSAVDVPGLAKAAGPITPFAPLSGARRRMLFVNDLGGDVDGLFAATHAVLSPSIDLRGIVATRALSATETAQKAAALTREMLGLMKRSDHIKVFEGATEKMAAGVPVRSVGTQAIIDEAMRTDSPLPLTVAVGGGLTEVASALMIEPRIADKMTLVWIGGNAYPDGSPHKYNTMVDPVAAQYVFNNSTVPLWQVPSDVYATCMISDTEIQAFVASSGQVGSWLYRRLLEGGAGLQKYGLNSGETYILGDSPLVLLTALNDWLPSTFTKPFTYDRTSTSSFEERPAPKMKDDGTYTPNSAGRKIRVYKNLDTRLMFSDFFAKLRVNYGS